MESLALAYALIVLGVVLLVVELFVPTGGVMFLISTLCILIGIGMVFIYGDTSTGLLTLLAVFVAGPVLGGLLLALLPYTPLGRRSLRPASDQDATVAAMPVNLELEALRGRYGRAASDLRPSGVVDFDGKRVDAITEGMLVAAGSWVRCIDVKSGRVLVRQVDKPDLRDLESAHFE
jgi:membrane-bound ClpP family serine protease